MCEGVGLTASLLRGAWEQDQGGSREECICSGVTSGLRDRRAQERGRDTELSRHLLMCSGFPTLLSRAGPWDVKSLLLCLEKFLRQDERRDSWVKRS